jgi:hypothetical protein
VKSYAEGGYYFSVIVFSGMISAVEPIVVVDKLVFSYGAVEVLHEISFSLNKERSSDYSDRTALARAPR